MPLSIERHTHMVFKTMGVLRFELYLGCDVITMMSAPTSDSTKHINTIRSPPALNVCVNPSVFQLWQAVVNDFRFDTCAVCLSFLWIAHISHVINNDTYPSFPPFFRPLPLPVCQFWLAIFLWSSFHPDLFIRDCHHKVSVWWREM